MAEPSAPARRCAGCATELAAPLLACPACGRLVHADELKRLAAEAREREEAGDLSAALTAWRGALALLPQGTRQHEGVAVAVGRLAAAAPAPATATAGQGMPGWLKRLGAVGALAFGAWKLAGFAKFATLLSFAASFALYWSTWGWRFAAGFLGSIYLHELGHVWALRRAGIPASAPMFIPGLGAYIRMHAAPPDRRTDAFVGLAGPVAGLLVALAFLAAAAATGSPLLRALAHAGAVINLFNLVPVWQLDGARGFAPLSRLQRFLLVCIAGVALAVGGEGLLWLFVLLGALRLLGRDAPERGDAGVFGAFAALIVVLALLSRQAS